MRTDAADKLLYALSYRIGQMQAGGWPWQRKDVKLLQDAQQYLLQADSIIRMQDDTIRTFRARRDA